MKSKFIIPSLLIVLTLFGCSAKQIVKVLGPPPRVDSPSLYKEPVTQSYINMARCWLSLKNYPYAVKVYEELLEEFPHEKFVVTESLFQIGRIYQDIEEYEKAIKAYDLLFLKSPESGRWNEALYLQAVCYEKIGEFIKAYEGYKAYMSLGENKGFYNQVQQQIRQMEYDVDGDGYPLYKEQEAGTSDEDANSYPNSNRHNI